MKAIIHKELTFQIISEFPNPNALEFLLKGISKPEWGKDRPTKIRWLKEWMDMPDSNTHSSKLKNDHSYKLTRSNGKFKIVFAKTGTDQATVVARLKYSARNVKEWQLEEEYRACALELAKSFHWVVDMSSPSHVIFGWDNKLHSKIEGHFDMLWKKYYDKNKIKFNRKNSIKDIYRWAKQNIEDSYERNKELLSIYKEKGTIKDGRGAELGKEVIQNLVQNIADYLHYINKKIDFNKMIENLP